MKSVWNHNQARNFYGSLDSTFLLIVDCHLLLYFFTHRGEKQNQYEQVLPQVTADFAKQNNALNTTRILTMALPVCFIPLIVYNLLLNVFFKGNSNIANIIVLSYPVVVSVISLNSLCNPFIYCYRNKTFRKTCKELLKMKCTNFNEE